MTLFEAIRELKEGQAIERLEIELDYYYAQCGERVVAYRAVEWRHGEPKMTVLKNRVDLNVDVRIVDLPKPKMSLDEGLEKAAFECLFDNRFDISEPTGYCWTANGVGYPTWSQAVAAAFASALRSLPIDWQAEADRKEGKA